MRTPVLLPELGASPVVLSVWFADVDNEVVRMVAASTGAAFGRAVRAGYIYTLAGSGPNDQGFRGNKKLATKAWIDTPQGVAVDGAGNIFFSDSGNNLIRLVPAVKGRYDGMKVKAGDNYTVAGDGIAGNAGNGFNVFAGLRRASSKSRFISASNTAGKNQQSPPQTSRTSAHDDQINRHRQADQCQKYCDGGGEE